MKKSKNFKISKKYLQLSYNGTEPSDVKARRKKINAEFIRTRALSQFFFVHFRPYTTSFPGLLLSLTLMSKGKKTLETSLDLTPSLKTSVDAKVEGLFWMWIIWKISVIILSKRNMVEKDVCGAHTLRSLECNFYVRTFHTADDF